MGLIEIYIQEVTKRLPEKNRGDIALELRSTIMDMLPDDYSEQEVKDALVKLGDPVDLANGYQDRPKHLIGPRLYYMYIHLLKMIIPIAVVVSVIALFASKILSYDGEEAVLNLVLDMIGEGIWEVISIGIHVFFWLTLVFAILERTDAANTHLPTLKKWTPEDLKSVTYIPKKKMISKSEVFFSLLWIAIWVTVYFYASSLVGVYEKGAEGLVYVTPSFNHDVLLSYWPFAVIVAGLEFLLAINKFIVGQWTKKIAVLNAICLLVSTIIFLMIISNPNLLTGEFIAYWTDIFSEEGVEIKFLYGIAFIYIITVAIDVYQGFRKANILS
ncbi:HAAS signaling domain-containing protein [Ferdinandcohnia quinoae]|uniref:Uncharacterized protein n=1 Tax=Fredinandcohnia quinoae TaxID=2918902 RepID=A0AAW5E3L5_9BACI|nr:hypothetical protein [Fredinandcohnia sp. SECRCQ15]MCH1624591.1 hypothetical protein [Fredinandcohnia sp. SECRCQ15]